MDVSQNKQFVISKPTRQNEVCKIPQKTLFKIIEHFHPTFGDHAIVITEIKVSVKLLHTSCNKGTSGFTSNTLLIRIQ